MSDKPRVGIVRGILTYTPLGGKPFVIGEAEIDENGVITAVPNSIPETLKELSETRNDLDVPGDESEGATVENA